MSVVVRGPDRATTMYTKGAPEVILPGCTTELGDGREQPLSDARRREIAEVDSAMACRALRVLALAYRRDPIQREGEYQETELVFAGLAGMIDPPREEAKVAVARCRAGRHPARDDHRRPSGNGRARSPASCTCPTAGDEVVSGGNLDAMSDEELTRRVEHDQRLRPRLGRAQAAGRPRLEAPRPGRGHDGRRRERRAGGEGGRHRHRHGHHRHRRDQGSVRHGADRRQLRLDRQRGGGRPRHLRQHPEVRALPAVVQHGRSAADVRGGAGRLAGAAVGDPDPVDQPGDRRPAGPGPGAWSRPSPTSCSGRRARRASR